MSDNIQAIQDDEFGLPPTKIKRTYKCKTCGAKTTNPREHLKHRQDVHGDKVKIVECPYCVYACQYRQKLNRHLKLVHKLIQDNKSIISSSSELPASNYGSLDNYPINYTATTTTITSPAIIYNDNEPLDLSYPQIFKDLIKLFEGNKSDYQNVFE